MLRNTQKHYHKGGDIVRYSKRILAAVLALLMAVATMPYLVKAEPTTEVSVPVIFNGKNGGASASVVFTPVNGGSSITGTAAYTVGADGGTAVVNVPNGTYNIEITKIGHTKYTITGYTVGTSALPSNITLFAGDINSDGFINSRDLSLLTSVYGSRTGDSKYNPAADFNEDGYINTRDISIITSNYTKRNTTTTAPDDENAVEIFNHDDSDTVEWIDGEFTSRKVRSTGDAIAALNDAKSTLGIDNASSEFKANRNDTSKYSKTYNLQQVYNGINVYGRTATVITDLNGNVEGVHTEYLPNIEINTTPSITEAKAITVACSQVSTVRSSTSKGLCVFSIEEYEDEPTLAYQVNITGICSDNSYFDSEIFVNAKTAEIILVDSNIKTAYATTGSGRDELGNNRSFPVWCDDSVNPNIYYMQDSNGSGFSVREGTRQSAVISNSRNSTFNNNPQAVSAYSNMLGIYQWYIDKFSHRGIDGKGTVNNTKIVVNNTETFSNNDVLHNNAASVGNDLVFGRTDYTHTYAVCKDVIAHEYQHGVFSYLTGKDVPYKNEPGAINEAYSDIMASLYDGNWTMGEELRDPPIRSAINTGSKPSVYKGDNWASTGWFASDNGGVHTNCTVLYHAAYLMSNANNQINNGLSNSILSQLWFESMKYDYGGSSKFLTVRRNIIKAAKTLNLSVEQISVIKAAFDEVNILEKGYTYVECSVKDADSNEAISWASCKVYKNGKVIENSIIPNTNSFKFSLPDGEYTIEISKSGYITFKMTLAVTYDDGNPIYLEPILLAKGTSSDRGTLSGTITNASTGASIPNVQMNFRSGWNNRTGTINNTVKTDNNGKYSLNTNIGNYTVELSCNGFIKTYMNVVITKNNRTQNGTMPPEADNDQYRAVLTWGSSPSDLDSHLVGPLSSGGTYHVYFSSMNAYDNGVRVANLDLDDTSSYGPETTIFTTNVDGAYYFYVHRYSSSGNLLENSGAQVKLYKGSEHLATYNVPTRVVSDGRWYWNVFCVKDDRVIFKNSITSSPDITYANNRIATFNAAMFDSPNDAMYDSEEDLTPELHISKD